MSVHIYTHMYTCLLLVQSLNEKIVTNRVQAPYLAVTYICLCLLILEGVPRFSIIRGGTTRTFNFRYLVVA